MKNAVNIVLSILLAIPVTMVLHPAAFGRNLAVFPAPKTYAHFAFGKVSYGLFYSVTANSTQSIETLGTSTTDYEHNTTDTLLTSNEITSNTTLINSVGTSLGFDFSKLSYAGSLNFGHTKKDTDSTTYTDSDNNQRVNIYNYQNSIQQKVTQLSQTGIQLIEKSGFINFTLEIQNFTLAKLSLSNINVIIHVIRPSDGAQVDLIGPIEMGGETVLNGTVIGATSVATDASSSVDIDPQSVYHRSFPLGGLGQILPNKRIIDYMQQSLVMVPEIQSFNLTADGKPHDVKVEEANLLKGAAKLTVLRPDGIEQEVFVQADGTATIAESLVAAGFDPTVAGTIISSMLGAVSDAPASPPPKLYTEPARDARWLVVQSNSIVDVGKRLNPGDKIDVLYLSNLDLSRAFPPEQSLDGEVDIFCDNSMHEFPVFLHNVQLGSMLRFRFAESRAGVATQTVKLADTLTDVSANTFINNPIAHKGVATVIAANTTLVDNGTVKVTSYNLTSDPSYPTPLSGNDADPLKGNLVVGIMKGPAETFLSDLVRKGDAEAFLDDDGNQIVQWVVTDDDLFKVNAGDSFGIIPMKVTASPVEVQLGRQATPPPRPPAHTAYVGPDVWALAQSWPTSFPYTSYKFYPNEIYKLQISSVDAVRVGQDGKLVNPGPMTFEASPSYCGIANTQPPLKPSCPSLVLRYLPSSPVFCWRGAP